MLQQACSHQRSSSKGNGLHFQPRVAEHFFVASPRAPLNQCCFCLSVSPHFQHCVRGGRGRGGHHYEFNFLLLSRLPCLSQFWYRNLCTKMVKRIAESLSHLVLRLHCDDVGCHINCSKHSCNAWISSDFPGRRRVSSDPAQLPCCRAEFGNPPW